MAVGTLSSADRWVTLGTRQGQRGFDFAVSGTFVGTVTVQASLPDRDDWIDVDELEAPGIKTGDLAAAWKLRAGFKTGEYTSGTAEVYLV